MTIRELGFALLALLIALIWSSWELVEDRWGGLTDGQKGGIFAASLFVIAWALWPVAKWLSTFFF